MEVLVHEELRESEPLGELMARLQALVEAIVDAPALTTRLIRVINAAHYRGLGAGQISSVQRAACSGLWRSWVSTPCATWR